MERNFVHLLFLLPPPPLASPLQMWQIYTTPSVMEVGLRLRGCRVCVYVGGRDWLEERE